MSFTSLLRNKVPNSPNIHQQLAASTYYYLTLRKATQDWVKWRLKEVFNVNSSFQSNPRHSHLRLSTLPLDLIWQLQELGISIIIAHWNTMRKILAILPPFPPGNNPGVANARSISPLQHIVTLAEHKELVLGSGDFGTWREEEQKMANNVCLASVTPLDFAFNPHWQFLLEGPQSLADRPKGPLSGDPIKSKVMPSTCRSWIPRNLSFCYKSLYWSIHTKDENKCRTAFAFIFGVIWLLRCGVTAWLGVFFLEIKCNGMTSFMEFMVIYL